MASDHVPNVWTQMNYVPPRGQCNFRQSLLSPKCSCLRYMLHPLKSSSSYECDGCSHHASFHLMENKEEDDIRKKWELEAKEGGEQEIRSATRPLKRLREIEYNTVHPTSAPLRKNGAPNSDDELEEALRNKSEAGSSKAKPKKGAGKTTAAARKATRSRGRVTEVLEDDEDYIELD